MVGLGRTAFPTGHPALDARLLSMCGRRCVTEVMFSLVVGDEAPHLIATVDLGVTLEILGDGTPCDLLELHSGPTQRGKVRLEATLVAREDDGTAARGKTRDTYQQLDMVTVDIPIGRIAAVRERGWVDEYHVPSITSSPLRGDPLHHIGLDELMGRILVVRVESVELHVAMCPLEIGA